MKSKLLLFVMAFIFCDKTFSQTLSPTVISSSGGFSSNGTAMLSSTVGEMTMVATFSAAGSILTQGFQQPEDFNVSVKDIDEIASGITLGPNPTHGEVNLLFNSLSALRIAITIFDINGKIVYRNEAEKQVSNNYVSLNLSSFASGDYILECKISEQEDKQPVSFSRKISLIK